MEGNSEVCGIWKETAVLNSMWGKLSLLIWYCEWCTHGFVRFVVNCDLSREKLVDDCPWHAKSITHKSLHRIGIWSEGIQ